MGAGYLKKDALGAGYLKKDAFGCCWASKVILREKHLFYRIGMVTVNRKEPRSKMSTENRQLMKKFRDELLIAGYSKRTLTMYCCYVEEFLSFLKNKHVKDSNHDDIISFLVKKKEAGLSNTSLALIYSSLNFFFKNIIKTNSMESVKRPKTGKKIPVVLTRAEVKALINAAKNERDRLILVFLYSSGCRVSECAKLKIEDIDFSGNTATVHGGKGNKDRLVIVSKKWIDDVKKYIEKKGISQGFVFGKSNGKTISEDTIQKITKDSAKKAGILKKVTPHVLRHSYDTHLLENGESIRKIQVLLGHTNLSTTQIYTKVSTDELKKVKNPFDGLK